MSRGILQKLRSVAVGLGVVGASTFVAVPTDGCNSELLITVEGYPGAATPVIPLPPPGDDYCEDWDDYGCTYDDDCGQDDYGPEFY